MQLIVVSVIVFRLNGMQVSNYLIEKSHYYIITYAGKSAFKNILYSLLPLVKKDIFKALDILIVVSKAYYVKYLGIIKIR